MKSLGFKKKIEEMKMAFESAIAGQGALQRNPATIFEAVLQACPVGATRGVLRAMHFKS